MVATRHNTSLVTAVKRLPILHFSVVYIFTSFVITERGLISLRISGHYGLGCCRAVFILYQCPGMKS